MHICLIAIKVKSGAIWQTIPMIKGPDGDSAYQVALNNGFEGTEAEWLESLSHGPKGDDGAPGTSYQFIFKRTDTAQAPERPVSTTDVVPATWSAVPLGVTVDAKYEWVSVRIKNNDVWTEFSIPGLWAIYGFGDSLPEIYIQDVEGLQEALDALELGINDKISKDLLPEEDTLKLPGADAFGVTLPKFLPKATSTSLGAIKLGTTLLMNEDGVTNVKLKMRELDENLTADPADGSVIVWDKSLQKYKNTTLSLTGLYHPLRGTAELDLTAKTLSSINLLIPKVLPTVENNQVALFALENGYSLENPGAGGVSTLDDLNDVALTNVADGHSLFKEGLNFVNKAAYTKAQIDALLLGLNGSYHPLGGSDLLDFRARLLRSKALYLPTEDFVPPGAGVAIFAKENGYTLIDPETSITEFTDLVDIAALTWLEGQALIYRNNAFINEAIYNKTQVDSLLTNLNMSTYLTKVEALSKYHPKFGFENGNPLDFTADRLKSNTLLIPKVLPTLENTEVGLFAVENGYSLSDPQGSAGLLTELDDVLLDTPLNDQALTYSTSLQKWINKTLSFSMFGDSLSADLVSTTETKKFVSNAQILSWNAKWDYDENTIKAVKVNAAIDSDKLGGIDAGNYWHQNNSNLYTVDWKAKVLRSKSLVVPKEAPIDLALNEVAVYALENGYSLEEPGNIGVTSLSALEDVTLTAPLVNNQILAYSLASQRWVNSLLSFSLFTDQLSADLVLVNDNRRFVTAAQILDWNSRWTYNEETIKAVKVNLAADSEKLGGILAGEYWHTGNSNLDTVDWKAKILRSKVLAVPKELPTSLSNNEIAIYALETGYSLSEPGGGSTVQVLNDLLDVVNTAPQPDDILFYDATSTAYINGPMTFNKITGMLDPSRITTGSTARFVTDAQIGLWNAKEDVSNRNQANGYLGLNADTKIDFWFLPDVILGQAKFGGTFNATGIIASDNADLNGLNLNALTPALYTGYFFIAQAGTTVVSIEVQTGDWIISNGAAGWAKVDNTDAVTSVNGRIGAIILSKSDVGLSNVDNTADANKNVLSATKLFTPRTLWGQSFDGTANISGDLSNVGHITGNGILSMGAVLIPKTMYSPIPNNAVAIVALENGYSIFDPEAGTVAGLDDLTDVTLVPRVDKQVLYYNGGLGEFTNGMLDFSFIQGYLTGERITQSPDYRFVTDAQKLAWNAKQDALNFVTVTEGKYLRDDNTFQTIETLTTEERSHLTSAYNHSIAFGNPHLTKVNELSDAVISGAVTGEVLMYNASTSKWYNAKVDIADVVDLQVELNARSLTTHLHDDRYYTETEIANFFSGSVAISGYNKSNWDTAYGWGNHASAGYALASSLSNYLGKYETYAMSKYVLESIPRATTQVGHFGWTDYQTTPYAGGGFLTLNLGSSLRSLLMIFPDYSNNDNIKVLTSIDGAPWGQQKEIAWKDHNHNGTYALIGGSLSQDFNAESLSIYEHINIKAVGGKIYFDSTGMGSSHYIGIVNDYVLRLYNGRGSSCTLDLENSGTVSMSGALVINGALSGATTITASSHISTSGRLLSGNTTDGVAIYLNGTFGDILGINTSLTEYNDLRLRASNTDQMFLRTNGNVDIGYSTAQGSKFAVNGSGYFDTSLTVAGITSLGGILGITPGRGAAHFVFTGTDADFGVARIIHTSTAGSGTPGTYTATLGLIDQRLDNLSGAYEPNLFINVTGAQTTVDLMRADVRGAIVFRLTQSGAATFASSVSASSFTSGGNAVLHAGNYSSYALPLSGGAISSTVANPFSISISGKKIWDIINSEVFFYAEDNAVARWVSYYRYDANQIRFYSKNASGVDSGVTLSIYDGAVYRNVIHSGNIGSQSVNYAASAATISNTGTVTLGSAIEANSITITQPTYFTDKPVKLLNFNWYSDTWSLGNIRSSATPSMGLGVYLNSVEKYRFTDSALFVGLHTVWHSGNLPITLSNGYLPYWNNGSLVNSTLWNSNSNIMVGVQRGDGAIGLVGQNYSMGYAFSTKFITLQSSSEQYGLTNDFGAGTSAQLSIVANQTYGNIGFYTGGDKGVANQRMHISKDGYVGIGYTDRSEKLAVAGTIWARDGVKFSNGGGGSATIYGSEVDGFLRISNNNIYTGDILFQSENVTQFALRGGKVDIGWTTNPSLNYKLSVNGSGYFNGKVLAQSEIALLNGGGLGSNGAGASSYPVSAYEGYGWNFTVQEIQGGQFGIWNASRTTKYFSIVNGGNAAFSGDVNVGTSSIPKTFTVRNIKGYGDTFLGINPWGGNVSIGWDADQGYKLAVNGTTRLHGNTINVSSVDSYGFRIFTPTTNSDGAAHYGALTFTEYEDLGGNYAQIRVYSNLYSSWGSDIRFFQRMADSSVKETFKISRNGAITVLINGLQAQNYLQTWSASGGIDIQSHVSNSGIINAYTAAAAPKTLALQTNGGAFVVGYTSDSRPGYANHEFKGSGYFGGTFKAEATTAGDTAMATFIQNSQGTYNWGIATYAPNIAVGTHVINLIGVAGSGRNSVYMGFTYVGAGSYSNKMTFGFHSNDHLLTINPYGAAVFSGSASSVTAPAFYHSSDMTLKNIISPLESSLDKLRNMSTFYYTLKDDSSQRIQLGMSAQEFDTYFPTLVGRDSNDKLQLEYPRISVLAVKAIQEIDKIQKDHDRRIEELEIEVKTLKQKLNATSN